MKGLQELGLPLDEKTQCAADELEEQLIQNEILPAVIKGIERRITQIQREQSLGCSFCGCLCQLPYHCLPINNQGQ